MVVGSTLYWLLPDSPQTASFLQKWESDYIITRLQQDSGTSKGKIGTHDKFSWSALKTALLEWKLWLAVFVYWGNGVTIYGFTYSAPSIILGLGYSAANAQLLTIPIYTVGVISTIFFSRWADRRRVRWPFIVGPYSIAAVGFIGLLAVPHPRLPGLTYALLFFIPAGIYPPLIGILAWIGNNLAPSWKRAVGMALLISLGNFGGAIGSNIFQEQQAPNYWLGYGYCLASLVAANIAAMILRFAYLRENKKRDGLTEQDIKEKYTEDDLLNLGDKSPLYRYVV